jgi:hypothetical protein
MYETIGWSEFRERFPKHAAEFERMYRLFLSFPGNCLFHINGSRIEVQDLYNPDNNWCCELGGTWTIDDLPPHME